MAEIVLGIGSSHTPQMSTSSAAWAQHADRDRDNDHLLGADGEFHTYDELLAVADPAVADELDPAVWEAKFERAQVAVATLTTRLAAAAPDVVVIVGDDQHELFGTDGIPAIGVFTGDSLVDIPLDAERLAHMPADIVPALWSHHADQLDSYPVAAELGRHVAASLADRFDLMIMEQQPKDRGLGHAFTFVRRRLHLEESVPIVPILLNTYYPPNVPTPGRCWRLGQALREAIDSWERPARIALFASGGLSHFVVLEELDRRVIAALEAGDGSVFDELPSQNLRSGTSETLNWVTVGGALADYRFDLLDYIPAYRSPAGTGCGMTFATWEPAGRTSGSESAGAAEGGASHP